MATYSNGSTEVQSYTRVDLTQFKRDDEAEVGHWRGFTKCRQPDGTVVAVSSQSDDEGMALGPCVDGREADRLIENFYR